MRRHLKTFDTFKRYIESPFINAYIRDYALNASETELEIVFSELKKVYYYCKNEDYIIFKLQYLLKRKEINELSCNLLMGCWAGESLCVGCSYNNCKFMNNEYEERDKIEKELKEIFNVDNINI